MRVIDYLMSKLKEHAAQEALVWRGQVFTYQDIINRIEQCSLFIKENNIGSGDIIILQGDYCLSTISLLISLLKTNTIIIVLSPDSKVNMEKCVSLTGAKYQITVDDQDTIHFKLTKPDTVNHQYWEVLRQKQAPGLVLFSSGSTGKSKAIVHNAENLLEKFCHPKKSTRVIGFLLFDHIGGLNTLFYTLFNGGCFITLPDRLPKTVCQHIEAYQANALTTTPTFLNLLLLSEAYNEYELSSLRYINFSTERMSQPIYEKLTKLFPKIRLSQAYGLSEVGVLPASSTKADPLWIQIDQEQCNYRVVDGLLELKIKSSMLGYLNADNPFTDDGWYKTGDMVEQVGDRLKILGRKSELINVGGEKVYPIEIEQVIEEMPEVIQASVWSEPHPIIGQIIMTKVYLKSSDSSDDFKLRLTKFCQERLVSAKVPRKITISNEPLHSTRFKKLKTEVTS